MSRQRKLSAILFADIVGYTSLMQSDEVKALTFLNKFKQGLETQIPVYRGTIIQFYGDGCLAVFDSPVDAVNCGKELQMGFQKEPSVPVRIGIHSGDVVFKEGNVFGDSVNIASRIESLGIPGAVLFSKRIKRHIANQPELRVASLGEFEFKNVNGAMEIFALANEGFAIPARVEMKGKLKSIPAKFISKRAVLLWGVIATLILLIGYFGWQYFFNPNKDLLSEEIRSARIAVLPFENKTNDKELEVLGDLAADEIIEGLMSLEDIKIVINKDPRTNTEVVKTDNIASFIKTTGTEKIIRGNFYKEGDRLIFRSRIEDANSGILDKALPPVSGNKNKATDIVKDLKQRILGYFAIKTHPHYSAFKDSPPPNFEAYKFFAETDKHFHSDYEKVIELCKKTIEIDSNFAMPYLTAISAHSNQGQYRKMDSVIKVIEKRKIHFNKIQQLTFEYFIEFDPYLKANIAKQFFEIDPKNINYNYSAANHAIIRNDPEESLRILQYVDANQVEVNRQGIALWFSVYAISLTRLHRLDEALDVLNLLPEEYEDFYYKTLVFALQDKVDSIQQMALKLENRYPSKDISWFYNRTALIYGVLDDKPKQKEWANKALQYLQKQPESVTPNHFDLARAYYLTEQYDKALDHYFELSRNADFGNLYYDNGLWNYLSRIGCIYAKTGKKEKALEMIKQLETVPDPYPEGRYSYGIARIYAQLGEKEKAMEYVQRSFNEGFNTADGYRYQDDLEMLPIYDYPPFEKFIKYKRKKLAKE